MRRFLFYVVWFLGACEFVMPQDPVRPTSFEVATVKLRRGTPPTGMACNGGPGTSDPVRLSCTNGPLAMLICMAYNVQYYQIVGPGWISNDRYDLAAVIPPNATRDEFRLMLQNLLAQRFQLKLHHETKPLNAYSLITTKEGAKLNESPKESSVSPGLNVGGTNGNIRVSAHAQTTRNLAGFLSTLLGVGGPVSDDTGLTGKYDFTLEYAPNAALDSGAGGISLFTALQSQLGLRLNTKKAPTDILVIDHAEKLPAEEP